MNALLTAPEVFDFVRTQAKTARWCGDKTGLLSEKRTAKHRPALSLLTGPPISCPAF
ncbi:hypothetical protein [Aurantiacibacter xanthus]|uniref:hypothetical protein n=1 Tax=Aurantiacibacter xanthus TaxID=1784712 RepID=UPI00174EB5B9|nr:hypothetical protein [Aurantiacibacter xanthus]